MADTQDTTVIRDDAESRYELVRDGQVIGVADFEPDDQGRLVFPHTEVDPAFNGQGLGSVLVRGAMEDVARRGETVVPVCPFVVHWLSKHEVPGLLVEQPEI